MDTRPLRFRLACLALVSCLSGALGRADLSTLAEDGPSSGTGFATPGLMEGQTTAVTTLSDAEVDINVHRGGGSTLKADVTATFYLDTPSVPPSPALLLVGFPVTGLFRGATRIEDFKVRVDRSEPPLVLRRLMRFPLKLTDVPVQGTFPAALGPSVDGHNEPELPTLLDGTQYFDAYLWTQPANPGKQTTVLVTYSLILEPQPLIYSKKLGKNPNPDVVPFDLMWAGEAGQKAYFFDYILRSGATWKGFIGHETVNLNFDRDLGVETQEVVIMGRKAVPFDWGNHANAVELHRAGVTPKHIQRETNVITWEINHEKPTEDILVEIPQALVRPVKRSGGN